MEGWAKLADAEKKATAAATIVEAKTESKLPEVPPNIRRCLQANKTGAKSSPKAKAGGKAEKKGDVAVQDKPSADALVLARLEQARKRDACARLLLQWYERNIVKPAKMAAK